MALVNLPDHAEYADLLQAMAEAGAFRPDVPAVTVRVGRGSIPAAGAALLATWGRWMDERDVLVSMDGPPGTMALLDRLGVTEALGQAPRHDQGRADASLYLPVRFIADGDDVYEATNAILDLVIRMFADARSFVPALEWAINETIDNIQIHAEAPVPGAVCARIDPSAHVIDIGIVDMGRGIRASLGDVLEPWDSHGTAIDRALQRGVTRDLDVGQGNGLAGALEITTRNQGRFDLWSGDAVFHLRRGEDRRFSVLPSEVPGTGASFCLDPRHPVDLADTFIGAPGFTFMEAEALRIGEAGGLVVRAEVSNTGTRTTARRLRHKVMNLVPDAEGAFTLDFEGIERASSSFLDELLGRMAVALGPDTFKQKVRLVNLNERLVNMANVVVQQRIAQTR